MQRFQFGFDFSARVFDCGAAALGLELTLQVGDLLLDPHNVRIFVGVLRSKVSEIQAEFGQTRRNGVARGSRVGELCQLPRQLVPPVHDHHQLLVEPPQRRQVRRLPVRQLAAIASRELVELLLLVLEFLLRFLDLRADRFIRGERVRDLCGRLGITPPIADTERKGGVETSPRCGHASELQPDIFAHLFHDRIRRRLLPQIRIQIELGDQLVQPRTALDLLAECAQPRLELHVRQRPPRAVGCLRPFHQQRGGGLVDIRQAPGQRERRREQHREHEQRRPLAPVPHGPSRIQAGCDGQEAGGERERDQRMDHGSGTWDSVSGANGTNLASDKEGPHDCQG